MRQIISDFEGLSGDSQDYGDGAAKADEEIVPGHLSIIQKWGLAEFAGDCTRQC